MIFSVKNVEFWKCFIKIGECWITIPEVKWLFEKRLLVNNIAQCATLEPLCWVPRRINRVADALAGRALATRKNVFWRDPVLHSERSRNVIIWSDAGVKDHGAGLGWLFIDMDTGKLLALASDYFPFAGGLEAEKDVNLQEMRALRQALRFLLLYARGAVGEVGQSKGGGFTQAQRERWRRQAGEDRQGSEL